MCSSFVLRHTVEKRIVSHDGWWNSRWCTSLDLDQRSRRFPSSATTSPISERTMGHAKRTRFALDPRARDDGSYLSIEWSSAIARTSCIWISRLPLAAHPSLLLVRIHSHQTTTFPKRDCLFHTRTTRTGCASQLLPWDEERRTCIIRTKHAQCEWMPWDRTVRTLPSKPRPWLLPARSVSDTRSEWSTDRCTAWRRPCMQRTQRVRRGS